MNMTSKIRLMAWQIDVFEPERGKYETRDDDRPHRHLAKWEGGGPPNRNERFPFSPWPHVLQAIDALHALIEKSQIRCTQRQSLWRKCCLQLSSTVSVLERGTDKPRAKSGTPLCDGSLLLWPRVIDCRTAYREFELICRTTGRCVEASPSPTLPSLLSRLNSKHDSHLIGAM